MKSIIEIKIVPENEKGYHSFNSLSGGLPSLLIPNLPYEHVMKAPYAP